jgi:DDE family transposase
MLAEQSATCGVSGAETSNCSNHRVQGLRLITKLRKSMRNQLLPLAGQLLLCKCAIIETIVDQLKNACQIERSRRRSPVNFLVHLLAGLALYCHQPKKPPLDLAAHPLLAGRIQN